MTTSPPANPSPANLEIVMGVVAFDVIGTLFTLEEPRRRLRALGAPEHTVELWFAGTLRERTSMSLAGVYLPTADVLAAELPRVLAAVGVEADESDRAEVLGGFAELEASAGAAEGCAALAAAGCQIVALTNAGRAGTLRLLERAGLAPWFLDVLSTDAVKVAKPHPSVYRQVEERFPDVEAWMVAAHAWDVAGAMWAGLRGAWVAELEDLWPDLYPEPDITAGSLLEACAAIAALAES
jgi:2-haloacid dehalogenase